VRPVWVADIFAAFPNPKAKRQVAALVFRAERNKPEWVEKAGATLGIPEVLNIFVVRHLWQLHRSARATGVGFLDALCPSGRAREKKHEMPNDSMSSHESRCRWFWSSVHPWCFLPRSICLISTLTNAPALPNKPPTAGSGNAQDG